MVGGLATIRAEQALLPGGWARDVVVTVGGDGRIASVAPFAARMEEMKLPFYYYENTEGGHGSGADLKQAARTTALTMTYMQKKLMD